MTGTEVTCKGREIPELLDLCGPTATIMGDHARAFVHGHMVHIEPVDPDPARFWRLSYDLDVNVVINLNLDLID